MKTGVVSLILLLGMANCAFCGILKRGQGPVADHVFDLQDARASLKTLTGDAAAVAQVSNALDGSGAVVKLYWRRNNSSMRSGISWRRALIRRNVVIMALSAFLCAAGIGLVFVTGANRRLRRAAADATPAPVHGEAPA